LRNFQIAALVQKLSLYNQTVVKETLPALRALEQLTVFLVRDPTLPVDDFDLPKVKARNGVIYSYEGPIFPFEQFIHIV
jgi:hypothetical protein